jgi:hypothetical protein
LLAAAACCGPALFTLDWAVLGAWHRGYRPRSETISSLSAHNAPGWGWMVAGQLALAAGVAALAVLVTRGLGRRGWPAAAMLTLAVVGTLQASAFRTICNSADAGWCTPLPRSAYPSAQWAHGIGTGVAFGGLLCACLATALAVWPDPAHRPVLVASAVCLAVALPHVVWFLALSSSSWHGWAEKVFLVSLAGWVAFCGVRLWVDSEFAVGPKPEVDPKVAK